MIDLKEFDNVIINLSEVSNLADITNLVNKKDRTLLLNYTGKKIANQKLLKNHNIFIENFGWSILFNDNFSLRWISEKHNVNFVKKNKNLIKENLINSLLKKIYSKKITIALEKTFLDFFRPFFRANFFIKILEKKIRFKKIYCLIGEKDNKLLKNYGVKLPHIFKNKKVIKDKNNIKNFLIIFAPVLTTILAFISKITLNLNFKKKTKELGIRLYNTGIKLKNKNVDRADWLLRRNFFNEKNSIFVEENVISKDFYSLESLLKYKILKYKKFFPVEKSNLKFLIQNLFLFFPLSFFLMFLLCFQNKILRYEYSKAWYFFIKWSSVVSIYDIKRYISYLDFDTAHIYRNIILNKNETKTFMYKHTNSEKFFDNQFYTNTNFYGCLYDYEFHWTNSSKEMAIANYTNSKTLVISGPVNCIKKNTFKSQKKNKIIFFPTSFYNSITNSVNNKKDHYNFLKIVLSVLNKFPKIEVVYKCKMPLNEYYKDIEFKKIIFKLKKNKKFKIIEYNKPFYDEYFTSRVVVSMPFTSPGIEALYHNKNTLYIDLSKKFKKSYFSKIKNYVVYNELEALNKISKFLKIKKPENQNKIKDRHFGKVFNYDRDFIIKYLEKI
tara:strand:- start:3145 stop:4974 length:1830 start_codon:yes stop_codon:yes gene_type:complete